MSLSTTNAPSGVQRIPGFAESGFHALPIGPSIVAPLSSYTPSSYPRTGSIGDFRLDQRVPRSSNLSPHDLRLNTASAERFNTSNMYTFQSGNPSPQLSTGNNLSPHFGQAPNEPISASSVMSSTQSSKNHRARQTRKQPSSRPAAKRMRDTRDREGIAIQQMEHDLEAEGRLADLKPLNANNKEEAGRRYPKADVLERYCDLSESRKRKATDETRKLHYDSRKCQVFERWYEGWSSAMPKEAREQLEAMMAEHGSPAPSASSDYSFNPSASYSGRSSFSDHEHDRSSASSAEWSATEERDFAAASKTPF